ncbi:MAG: hypothetical protein ACK4YP_24365, partial [Myxococcota bacterium]
AGRALRRGDVAGARARVDASRSRWAEAPGVDALDAAILAREGPVLPAPPPGQTRRARAPTVTRGPVPERVGELVGLPAPGTLFVSFPFVGRPGRAPPPPDLRVAARTALVERVERILALAADPGDRARAAWWAMDGGHAELARWLVAAAGDPGALTPPLRALRVAVLRAVGEPVGEAPAAAVPGAEDSPPCFHPYRADPPPAAWAAGGMPSGG